MTVLPPLALALLSLFPVFALRLSRHKQQVHGSRHNARARGQRIHAARLRAGSLSEHRAPQHPAMAYMRYLEK
ncbi:hypothetical protein V8E36_003620 [Tilletia maclaganii]